MDVISDRAAREVAELGADEVLAARDGGREVGRLALWWSDVPAREDGRMGCLGGFEAEESGVAEQLLARGCDRLREEGCGLAVGPMNGNTWRSYRFVVEGAGRPPFFMEPANPAEWPGWWMDAGFQKLAGYSSSRLALELGEGDGLEERVMRRLEARGVSVRPVDVGDLDRELRAIHEVCLEAFSKNYLYTPLDVVSFVGMYQKVAPFLKPGYAWIAECDGVACGFVFGMPDLLAVKGGRAADFIVKTLAVLPERRFAGLGSLLVERVHRVAVGEGFTHAIHALQHDGNSSRRITGRHHGEVIRRYALFCRELMS
ncbi:MAG: GNAT family N-acetyltransferase [Verrucomicrobiota bacterium JB025]|nr:N-acetyltransferase [Verrucomicrobiota bacterium JB025]